MRNTRSLIPRVLLAALDRLQRRFQTSRPGSIMILVVALLVLLALMGTAYISTARLDRYGANQMSQIGQYKDITDSLLRSQIDYIKNQIAADNSVTTSASVSTVGLSTWLASRAMMLLPDLTNTASALPPAANTAGVPNGGVSWQLLSRRDNVSFESPLGTNTVPDVSRITYDQGDLKYWMRPTNAVVYYSPTGSLSTTDPALIGHTYVFPAFKRTYFDYTNKKWVDDPTGSVYMAADAQGTGIADCGLIRLTETPFMGVTYFVGVRIVDNADAYNVNTAWSPQYDQDVNGNCFNFFPSDLNLLGTLSVTNNGGTTPNEMLQINNLRFKNIDTTLPGVFDDVGARSDITYLNLGEAFWDQLAKRPSNPNLLAKAGDNTAPKNYERPFDVADTSAFAYRGGMVNSDAGPGYFDNNLYKFVANDSIYQGALNYTTATANHFKFLAANDAGYYFDYNYNFSGDIQAPTIQLGTKMGLTYGGRAFRTPRAFLVANNPVKNLARELDKSLIPPQALTGTDAMIPADAVYSHKVGLNTAAFGDLYRTFFTVFSDPILGTSTFVVPGDITPGVNIGQFRSPLRDPAIGTSKGGLTTAANNGANKLDSTNVVLLRSAMMAANVETMRESHGTNTGNFFIPNITRRVINLKTNKASVQAAVYGVAPQPFITEVFASTDQSDHGGVSNKSGFVAIELYNPYPFDIDMKDWGLYVIDRKTGGSYPAMKVTKLTLPAALPTIASQSTVVLTNYKIGGDAPYLPTYVPAPTGTTFYAPELHKLIEDSTVATSGGELVILRPITGGGPPEAPVDSYDFTGLTLGTPKSTDAWHYVRKCDTGKAVDNWQFVYPGLYVGKNATGGAAATSKTPRLSGTEFETSWDSTNPGTEPWDQAATPPPTKITLGLATNDTTFQHKFQGIQLFNVDFGGFNKPTGAGKRQYPFGGFARVGDVIQATYIGSYVIAPTITAGSTPTTVLEINPVTMDSAYADDGDDGDDVVEQIGRFVPIAFFAPGTGLPYDDYNAYGYYGDTVPSPDPTLPKLGTPARARWRYHYAMNVLNSLTVVSNPHDDAYPNIAKNSYVGPGNLAPTPVANTIATATSPNGAQEIGLPVEGLVNLNSASWQVLAGIEWIPAAKTATIKTNEEVAKLIVRYRDMDDGVDRGKDTGGNKIPPQGHGPFNNLMELNSVSDPADRTRNFGNAFGAFNNLAPAPNDGMPDIAWGNYDWGAIVDPTMNTKGKRVPYDYAYNTLMVSRISNMLTLRSDSFTAYLIVQGWKNVGTAYPELVVQKRAALLIDRSGVTPTNKTVTTTDVATH